MNASELTPSDFDAALEAIGARGVAASIRAMLSAHVFAPGKIATMRLLGDAAGISQRHTNRLYGQFAGRVRREVGLRLVDLEIETIATWPAPYIDAAEEFSFRMRPAFASALMRSGLVERSRRRHTRRTTPPTSEEFYQDAVRRSQLSRWERNRKARAACIAHFGEKCQACRFSFQRRYGPLGTAFIEVHHVTRFAESVGRHKIDPTVDLVPLCSNCHRMVHREDPPLGVAALRKIVGRDA